MEKEKSSHRAGLVYIMQAYILWGVLPLYWKLLKHVPAQEILTHRIFWSLIFILLLLWARKNLKLKAIFTNIKLMKSLVATSILIGINWGFYIYAVNSDQILEASMGYYINPLVSVLLGLIILKEKLDTLKIVALLLAAAGVIYITLDYGEVPWLSLILAFSFGFYGLLKKMTPINSLQGLAVETMILSPICLGFILFNLIGQTGSLFMVSWSTDIFLIMAGVATTLPLFWFAKGAKRIPLSSVGFLQYISPSISMLIGIFIYHEKFGQTQLVSFGFIWLALIIYTYSLFKKNKKKVITEIEMVSSVKIET
ncbi:MAG: EamA family transporter RarD [Bacteroidales bacterium]|nr:EamA family transporter RarD [Bacteroidales bacterium]